MGILTKGLVLNWLVLMIEDEYQTMRTVEKTVAELWGL